MRKLSIVLSIGNCIGIIVDYFYLLSNITRPMGLEIQPTNILGWLIFLAIPMLPFISLIASIVNIRLMFKKDKSFKIDSIILIKTLMISLFLILLFVLLPKQIEETFARQLIKSQQQDSDFFSNVFLAIFDVLIFPITLFCYVNVILFLLSFITDGIKINTFLYYIVPILKGIGLSVCSYIYETTLNMRLQMNLFWTLIVLTIVGLIIDFGCMFAAEEYND